MLEISIAGGARGLGRLEELSACGVIILLFHKFAEVPRMPYGFVGKYFSSVFM